MIDAFRQADHVLLQGVSGITDLITTPGLINLDFADVKSVMQGAGSALMGIGSARGEDRAIAAAESAISSPLLEASIDGAHGVLLSIAGGSDLGLFEINEAARLVSEAAHAEPTSSSARSSTTPSATRCGSRSSPPASTAVRRRRRTATVDRREVVDETPAAAATAAAAPVYRGGASRRSGRPGPGRSATARSSSRARSCFDDADDDLDIPDFLKWSRAVMPPARPAPYRWGRGRLVVTGAGVRRAVVSAVAVRLAEPRRPCRRRRRRRCRQPGTCWPGAGVWRWTPMAFMHPTTAAASPGQRRAGSSTGAELAGVDILVTTGPASALVALAADCVPVLLVDHAPGCRGSRAQPGGAGCGSTRSVRLSRRWSPLGARPDATAAALGPAICGRCYAVPPSRRRAGGRRRTGRGGHRGRRPARRWTCGPGSSPGCAGLGDPQPRWSGAARPRTAGCSPIAATAHRPPGRGRGAAGGGGMTGLPVGAARARTLAHASRARIEAACARRGRDPADVTLVVVTKTWPAADVADAGGARCRDVGENRDQEAAPKAAACADLGLRWHFVGPAAAQQGRSVARYADVVQSVDRAGLVGALDRAAPAAGRRVGVCVQVDLAPAWSTAAGRGGAPVEELAALADPVAGSGALDLLGVMAVAPLGGGSRDAVRAAGRHPRRRAREHPQAVMDLGRHVRRPRGGDPRRARHTSASAARCSGTGKR